MMPPVSLNVDACAKSLVDLKNSPSNRKTSTWPASKNRYCKLTINQTNKVNFSNKILKKTNQKYSISVITLHKITYVKPILFLFTHLKPNSNVKSIITIISYQLQFWQQFIFIFKQTCKLHFEVTSLWWFTHLDNSKIHKIIHIKLSIHSKTNII